MGRLSWAEIISGIVIFSIQGAVIGGVVYGAIHLYHRINKVKR